MTFLTGGDATAPLIELAIEPGSMAELDKMRKALQRLTWDDPMLRFVMDRETGQTMVGGRNEEHLATAIDRLKRADEVEVNVGAPQVAYRETLGRRGEIDYTHKKQSGGSGEFARIKMVFEPGQPGSGYHFESKIANDAMPEKLILGVERALEYARAFGVLAAFPVIDFTATLADGVYHDVDSSVLAFEVAARAAFREGLAKAECKLLEPVMKVEVTIPKEHEAECVDDLGTRRGQEVSVEARGDMRVVSGLVPLANMFGYANSLRELTFKRGAFHMDFDHYAPLPLPPDDDPFRPAVGMRA